VKVLVTGASGFIGSRLIPRLLEAGHELTLLSRREFVGIGYRNLEAIISSPDQWPRTLEKRSFDACVHLAWIATPGLYLTSAENESLAETTTALAETLFKGGLKHFIATGTCIEYASGLGEGVRCIENETSVNPVFPYAIAKNSAREGLQRLAATHGAEFSWARVFYAYGSEEPSSKTVTMFIRTLLSGERLVLRHPHSIKDFIHVDDIAGALAHFVNRHRGEGVVNIGSGCATTIRALASQVARELGANESLIQDGGETVVDPYSYHVADITKLRAAGWNSHISLLDGIGEMVKRAL